jgi:hypothetical protein
MAVAITARAYQVSAPGVGEQYHMRPEMASAS